MLTFGPDGVTGHPDHRTVSAWATAAFDRAAPPGARLLFAATSDGWAQRWHTLNERFAVYPDGYPVTTPTDRFAVDLLLDRDTVTP